MAEVSQEALDRLAGYWGRAQIMRRHVQDFIDSYGGIKKAVAKGNDGSRNAGYLTPFRFANGAVGRRSFVRLHVTPRN